VKDTTAAYIVARCLPAVMFSRTGRNTGQLVRDPQEYYCNILLVIMGFQWPSWQLGSHLITAPRALHVSRDRRVDEIATAWMAITYQPNGSK